MSLLQAVLLGVLQGLTEFFPVSSSGHLLLARASMGLGEIPVLFDVLLHIATLVVVVWVFRSRVGGMFAAVMRLIFFRSRDEDKPVLGLVLRLGAASLITAGMGMGISLLEFGNSPVLVGVLFLFTAGVLCLTMLSRGQRLILDLGWKGSLLIGMAQGLGVLPGVSRSGITIGTGLLCGLDRKAAVEFSFLLSIPAILGALVLNLNDFGELSLRVSALSLLAGFLSALLVGYGAVRLLLHLTKAGRIWIFAIYLIPAGTWAVVHFGF